MRNIIAALALVLGAASAFGQAADTESTVTYVYGSGSSYNFCFNNDYFCFDRTKQDARRNAVDQADMQCRINHGQSDQFGASCNDFCNPSFFPPPGPPNNGSTSVSCNANCQVRCEIPDQNVEVTE